MIIELSRALGAALLDGTVGVNAQLSAATFDSTDTIPPLVAAVLTVADNVLKVREEDLAAGPRMTVTVSQAATGEGQPFPSGAVRDASFEVVVDYFVRDPQDFTAARSTAYTLRAAMKAITHYLLIEPGHGTHAIRNGVAILSAPKQTTEYGHQDVYGAVSNGRITMTLMVRDLSP
jgi:hypothetical protein